MVTMYVRVFAVCSIARLGVRHQRREKVHRFARQRTTLRVAMRGADGLADLVDRRGARSRGHGDEGLRDLRPPVK